MFEEKPEHAKYRLTAEHPATSNALVSEVATRYTESGKFKSERKIIQVANNSRNMQVSAMASFDHKLLARFDRKLTTCDRKFYLNLLSVFY